MKHFEQGRPSIIIDEPRMKEIHEALFNSEKNENGAGARRKTRRISVMKTKEGQFFMDICIQYEKLSESVKENNQFPLELEEKFSLVSIRNEIDSFDVNMKLLRLRIMIFFIKR